MVSLTLPPLTFSRIAAEPRSLKRLPAHTFVLPRGAGAAAPVPVLAVADPGMNPTAATPITTGTTTNDATLLRSPIELTTIMLADPGCRLDQG